MSENELDSEKSTSSMNDSDSEEFEFEELEFDFDSTHGKTEFSHQNFRLEFQKRVSNYQPNALSWQNTRFIEQMIEVLHRAHHKTVAEKPIKWLVPIVETQINTASDDQIFELADIKRKSTKTTKQAKRKKTPVPDRTKVSKYLKTAYFEPDQEGDSDQTHVFDVDTPTVQVINGEIVGMYYPHPNIYVPVNQYDKKHEDIVERLRYVIGKDHQIHVPGVEVSIVGYLKIPIEINHVLQKITPGKTLIKTKQVDQIVPDYQDIDQLPEPIEKLDRSWLNGVCFYPEMMMPSQAEIVQIHEEDFKQCRNWIHANMIFQLYNLTPDLITAETHHTVSQLFDLTPTATVEPVKGHDFVGSEITSFINRRNSFDSGLDYLYYVIMKQLEQYGTTAGRTKPDEVDVPEPNPGRAELDTRLTTGEWLIQGKAWLDNYGYLNLQQYNVLTDLLEKKYLSELWLYGELADRYDHHERYQKIHIDMVDQWTYRSDRSFKVVPYDQDLHSIPLLVIHFMGLYLPNIQATMKQNYLELLEDMTVERGVDRVFDDGNQQYRVACIHVYSWLTEGFEITLANFGTETEDDWVCQHCGEKLVERDYDWFQGYQFQRPINVGEDLEQLHQLFGVSTVEEAELSLAKKKIASEAVLTEFEARRDIEKTLMELLNTDIIKESIDLTDSSLEHMILLLPKDHEMVVNVGESKLNFSDSTNIISSDDVQAFNKKSKTHGTTKTTRKTPKIFQKFIPPLKKLLQLIAISQVIEQLLPAREAGGIKFNILKMVKSDYLSQKGNSVTVQYLTGKGKKAVHKKTIDMKEWLVVRLEKIQQIDIDQTDDVSSDTEIVHHQLKLNAILSRDPVYRSSGMDALIHEDNVAKRLEREVNARDSWFSDLIDSMPFRKNIKFIVPSTVMDWPYDDSDVNRNVLHLPGKEWNQITEAVAELLNKRVQAAENVGTRNCMVLPTFNGYVRNTTIKPNSWLEFIPTLEVDDEDYQDGCDSSEPYQPVLCKHELDRLKDTLQSSIPSIDLDQITTILMGKGDNQIQRDLHEQYLEETNLMTYDQDRSKTNKKTLFALASQLTRNDTPSYSRADSEHYADHRQLIISLWNLFRSTNESLQSMTAVQRDDLLGIKTGRDDDFSFEHTTSISAMWVGDSNDNQNLVCGFYTELINYMDHTGNLANVKLVEWILSKAIEFDRLQYPLEEYQTELNKTRYKNFINAMRKYEKIYSNRFNSEYIRARLSQGRVPDIVSMIEEQDAISSVQMDEEEDEMIAVVDEDGNAIES